MTTYESRIKNFYNELFGDLLTDTKKYLKSCCFNDSTTDSEIKREIENFIQSNFNEIDISIHKENNSFLVFITLNQYFDVFAIDRKKIY